MYVVFDDRPVLLYDVTPAPTVVICDQVPELPVLRSILNPLSLLALSCHVSEMPELEYRVARKLDGAAGADVAVSAAVNSGLEPSSSEYLALDTFVGCGP